MATRREVIQKLADRGITDRDKIKKIVAQVEARGGITTAESVVPEPDIPATFSEADAELEAKRQAIRSKEGLETDFTERVISAAAPRSAALEKGSGILKTLAAGAADVASLPLRTLAAVPALAPGGETFEESITRTRGKERGGLGNIAQFGGDILRSPAAGAAGLVGKIPGVSGLAGKTLQSVAEAAPSIIASQVERIGEGKKVSGKEALLELGAAALLPAVGAGLERTGKKLFTSAIKPAKKLRVQGFDPENIIKHDIGGSFSQIVKKSQGKIDDAIKQADDIIENAVKTRPNSTVDLDAVMKNFSDELGAGRLDEFFDDEEAAIKIIDGLRSSLTKRDISGIVTLDKAQKAKKLFGKGVFEKGAVPTTQDVLRDRVRKILNLRLRDEIEKVVPEIAGPNKLMRELIPVQKAVLGAIERTGNNNLILNASNLGILASAGGFGAATGRPAEAALAGGALSIGKEILNKGRGAQLATKAGQAVGRISGAAPAIGAAAATNRGKVFDDLSKSRTPILKGL